jgi:hypothetical protein
VSPLPALAVALPGTIVVLLSLGSALLALSGTHPLWTPEGVNMSEAAALRDAATVVALLRAGESADERRAVRAGIVSRHQVSLTPLEAAIAARRPEVVEVILWAGPRLDDGAWRHARCLAALSSDEELGPVVERYRPAAIGADVRPHCAGIRQPW